MVASSVPAACLQKLRLAEDHPEFRQERYHQTYGHSCRGMTEQWAGGAKP